MRLVPWKSAVHVSLNVHLKILRPLDVVFRQIEIVLKDLTKSEKSSQFTLMT